MHMPLLMFRLTGVDSNDSRFNQMDSPCREKDPMVYRVRINNNDNKSVSFKIKMTN